MSDRTLVVFTYRSVEALLEERGSQAWALKPANAQRCKYIVCTRNRYHEGSGPEEHGAAFLVGKISVVEASPERPERYIVRFDAYAVLDPQPTVWKGARNPVWYVEDIRELSIDPDALEWRTLPEHVEDSAGITTGGEAINGLTFDQVRAGLAVRYGVPPEKIDIVFRG